MIFVPRTFPKKEAFTEYMQGVAQASGNGLIHACYQHLSILDSKSSALLRFDALILTALTFVGADMLKQHASEPSTVSYVLFGLLSMSGLLFTISILLCLSVVYLHWADSTEVARDKKEQERPATGDQNKPSPTVSGVDKQDSKVASVVWGRTRRYWIAWGLALVAFCFGFCAVGTLAASRIYAGV